MVFWLHFTIANNELLGDSNDKTVTVSQTPQNAKTTSPSNNTENTKPSKVSQQKTKDKSKDEEK